MLGGTSVATVERDDAIPSTTKPELAKFWSTGPAECSGPGAYYPPLSAPRQIAFNVLQ
jgi:hypothetical protein